MSKAKRGRGRRSGLRCGSETEHGPWRKPTSARSTRGFSHCSPSMTISPTAKFSAVSLKARTHPRCRPKRRRGNGHAGKRARKGEPYRIAILDMHMPDTDGQSLARMIKSDPAIRDVILISLSSIGDQIYLLP